MLNANQTEDILETTRVVEALAKLIPNGNIDTLKSAISSNNISSTISYGDINITIQGGDRKTAQDLAVEINKQMRKRGR